MTLDLFTPGGKVDRWIWLGDNPHAEGGRVEHRWMMEISDPQADPAHPPQGRHLYTAANGWPFHEAAIHVGFLISKGLAVLVHGERECPDFDPERFAMTVQGYLEGKLP